MWFRFVSFPKTLHLNSKKKYKRKYILQTTPTTEQKQKILKSNTERLLSLFLKTISSIVYFPSLLH